MLFLDFYDQQTSGIAKNTSEFARKSLFKTAQSQYEENSLSSKKSNKEALPHTKKSKKIERKNKLFSTAKKRFFASASAIKKSFFSPISNVKKHLT